MLNTAQTLDFISESGIITVDITLKDPSTTYTQLYLDQYYYEYDEELPKNFEDYVIGYISSETSEAPSAKNDFFNLLQKKNIIYRALESESPHFYYVFFQTHESQIRIPLVKLPFSSLHPDFSYVYSLSFTYPAEILLKYNFATWIERYKQCLAQWINFSSYQKTKILSLKEDIKNSKSQNKDPRKRLKSFGDCLLCYERARNIVFLPCGHVVSCLQCAVCKLKVEITDEAPTNTVFPLCPICKQEVKNAIEIFI